MINEAVQEEPSITCPRCNRTSYNPNDIKEGYCGHCHDWTASSPRQVSLAEARQIAAKVLGENEARRMSEPRLTTQDEVQSIGFDAMHEWVGGYPVLRDGRQVKVDIMEGTTDTALIIRVTEQDDSSWTGPQTFWKLTVTAEPGGY